MLRETGQLVRSEFGKNDDEGNYFLDLKYVAENDNVRQLVLLVPQDLAITLQGHFTNGGI